MSQQVDSSSVTTYIHGIIQLVETLTSRMTSRCGILENVRLILVHNHTTTTIQCLHGITDVVEHGLDQFNYAGNLATSHVTFGQWIKIRPPSIW
jgi:hypothetical protein